MESVNTNSPSPEHENPTITPLELALNGLRLRYDGFVDDDQLRLAGLLDRYNALDHSMEVIKLDAEVKLANRHPSPLTGYYETARTEEGEQEILDAERPLSKAEYEELENREVQDWEVEKFNEIRQRQKTIRRTMDQAARKPEYDEDVAEVAEKHKKHQTTHRPTTSLEKDASDRHVGILDGSYVRKDRLTQALAHFEDSHGDEASQDSSELHHDQAKNLRKQERARKRALKAKVFAENEVERSLHGEGAEQFRIRMKQERIAKKIAKLSKKVRAKNLWIDDLFELNPTPPTTNEEPVVATEPGPEQYRDRPYDAMTAREFTTAKSELSEKQSRTEKAMNVALGKLSLPRKNKESEQTVDIEYVTGLLNEIDGATPALAKFTLQRLQREGIIDTSGKVVVEQDVISDFINTRLPEALSTRPEEAKTKEATKARLEGLRSSSDKIYAFALGHVGGFYSKKNDFEPLPRLSPKSLANAIARGLGEEEATDENVTKAYSLLIKQGILSSDGKVIQSRETIRGALGALYGDDASDSKQDKKKKQRNQRRTRQ